MIITSSQKASKVKDVQMQIGNQTVRSSLSARNLGAVFDLRLMKENLINAITRKMYYNIRRIAKVRKNLTHQACAKAINATVLSHLDFNNCLLLGLPDKSIHKIQVA